MAPDSDKEKIEHQWNVKADELREHFEGQYIKEKQRAAQLEQELTELKKNNNQQEFIPRILTGSAVALLAIAMGHLIGTVGNALYGFSAIVFITSAHPNLMEPVVSGLSKLLKRLIG